ncbi:MAG: hypothetical protein CML22_07340 [Rheinheimera sp.]|nr:hypothetical protein [Rheinheimera sp.]MBM34097.1 hypothetical protein [Rheinheimera sp.]|tara:strand:+ start:404 stop:664 length:261 start_codon:yes stop_codon:yes gene_type:complete
MRFYCLARARMAKWEVVQRILDRKISDGQWEALPEERARGVAFFQKLREQHQRGLPVGSLLELHPQLDVHYHPRLKKHVVVLPEVL